MILFSVFHSQDRDDQILVASKGVKIHLKILDFTFRLGRAVVLCCCVVWAELSISGDRTAKLPDQVSIAVSGRIFRRGLLKWSESKFPNRTTSQTRCQCTSSNVDEQHDGVGAINTSANHFHRVRSGSGVFKQLLTAVTTLLRRIRRQPRILHLFRPRKSLEQQAQINSRRRLGLPNESSPKIHFSRARPPITTALLQISQPNLFTFRRFRKQKIEIYWCNVRFARLKHDLFVIAEGEAEKQ
ncbi:hypothetical protein T01_1307 [Trichinella spiralis]|uniref:Uncharacterized protein n=1 Tax=Trichinella spiralis TaxID=6334 RepID=A0A0V1BC14_TRISP|nr:hypothetical protein T01_1307 [Trichinella spiralis]